MALVIFDLDNTLISGDSDHAWGEFLVERKIVDAEHYQTKNDQFFQDYQSGSLNIQEYLAFALEPLANNPLDDLLSWRKAFLTEKILPLMLPKAKALIEKHRKQGDYLLIITATNHFVTELIAQLLEVDDLIATEPEKNDQGFTGNISGTPSFQEGKITRLNEWLKTHKHSMAGSYFYSDSHNDLPLLKLVDNPIAVDPDDTLRAYCEKNDWPVQSLRNT
ncbi:MAG: HAD superfamily hydrolase (TIGR01490 family) [Oleiphilaceae bacterium]